MMERCEDTANFWMPQSHVAGILREAVRNQRTIGEKVEEEGKGQREEEENRTGIFWLSPSYD